MKKLLVLMLIGLLAACESSALIQEEEVVEPDVVEVPPVEVLPEVIEEVIEEEVEETPESRLSSTVEPPEVCRLEDGLTDFRGPSGIGVDIKDQSFPSSGLLRIAIVYVDFSDYRWQREESTYELTTFLIDPIQAYYDAMSGGRIQFEWVALDEIISLPLRAEEYNITRGMDEGRVDIKNAVNTILERQLNLNEWDAILYGINPDVPEAIADVSSASLIGGANDSYFYHMALLGMDTRRSGYVSIAHEMGHMFGLPDLYVNVCYNNQVCNDGTVNWLLQFQHAGSWSLMSRADHPNNELMGWERYKIGWIADEEVHCIAKKEEHIIHVHPLNSEGLGSRLIAINLNESQNLIIEMRKQDTYCKTCYTGLLVYTMDTSITHESGYVKVVRPAHSTDITLQDALITNRSGFNQVSYEGWQIEIIEEYQQGLIVRITNEDA